MIFMIPSCIIIFLAHPSLQCMESTKWMNVLLVDEIPIGVARKHYVELVDYITNNITKKHATHILYLGKNKNESRIELKKDGSVTACSIIILVDFLSASIIHAFFHPSESENPLENIYTKKKIGHNIIIFQTNHLSESWIEVKSKDMYELYVVCASMVEQSWKLASESQPDQNAVNVVVNQTYFFEVSIEIACNKLEVDLHCHSEEGEEDEVDKEKVKGGFSIKVARTLSFYCYVRFSRGLRRYYNKMIISSITPEKRITSSRLTYMDCADCTQDSVKILRPIDIGDTVVTENSINFAFTDYTSFITVHFGCLIKDAVSLVTTTMYKTEKEEIIIFRTEKYLIFSERPKKLSDCRLVRNCTDMANLNAYFSTTKAPYVRQNEHKTLLMKKNDSVFVRLSFPILFCVLCAHLIALWASH